jgi:hypothetical protein
LWLTAAATFGFNTGSGSAEEAAAALHDQVHETFVSRVREGGRWQVSTEVDSDSDTDTEGEHRSLEGLDDAGGREGKGERKR